MISATIQDATHALLAAALLRHGRALDGVSLALLLLALACLPFMPAPNIRALLGASLALWAVQHYYAFRVEMDAYIFEHWAKRWTAQAAPDISQDLSAFDQAVTLCFGKTLDPKALVTRVHGAKKLFHRQGTALAFQFFAVVAALLSYQ